MDNPVYVLKGREGSHFLNLSVHRKWSHTLSGLKVMVEETQMMLQE